MIRELLDRFPCSNASRNAERKRGRGRSMMRSNDFTARLHVRFGGRPRNFLDKIRTYPAGSVEPWNTRTRRAKLEKEEGRERKRKRKREILKLSNPLLSFRHFGAKKHRYESMCNRWNRRMRVLFAMFLGFWSSIKRLETENVLYSYEWCSSRFNTSPFVKRCL